MTYNLAPSRPEGRRGREPLSPGHAERVALPVHLRPVAAALFDDLLDTPPDHATASAMASLERGRVQLAGLVACGTQILVDAYRVRLAAGCPASAVGGGNGFSWTPATAARHLGLRAVALHLCGDMAVPVEAAVDLVMAELMRGGGSRTPGPWLAGLDPSGRAVAKAHARRWAEQVVAWVPLRLVSRRSLRFLDDDWWPGGRRERTLVIHGRRDITIDLGGRRVAVTVAGGMADGVGAADADALTALAATLCDPRARLVRVVRVHPASGEVVAVDVTAALLDRGVAAALSTASALASTSPGDQVPTSPGPGCTWCDRRAVCQPGITWLHRPDRRFMGLPVMAELSGQASRSVADSGVLPATRSASDEMRIRVDAAGSGARPDRPCSLPTM